MQEIQQPLPLGRKGVVMKRVSFLFVCFGAVAAYTNYAVAQSNVCVELAREIGMNYAKSFAADEQHAIAQADLCSEQYSSASQDRKLQLQASYKLFSGSASASDEEVTTAQSKYCENHFGDYWRQQLKSAEARTVSSEGAAVISSCLALTSDALLPTLEIANEGKEITMGIQYKPNFLSDIEIRLFGPIDLKENSCTVTKSGSTVKVSKLSDVSQTLHPTQSVTIVCNRPSQTTMINNVNYTCTRETIFNIATSGPVKTMKIPRVCSQTIQESRADQLEKEIRNLENENQNLKAELAEVDPDRGTAGAAC
jgi:hypothetical protein